ncbi:MAG: hypothetical protein ACRDJH_11260 [Thermomicrobiales bacterium]
MNRKRIGRHLRLLVAAIVVPVLIFGIVAFYIANQAGALPWQADPTPIPVTPFANLAGPAGADATATVDPDD